MSLRRRLVHLVPVLVAAIAAPFAGAAAVGAGEPVPGVTDLALECVVDGDTSAVVLSFRITLPSDEAQQVTVTRNGVSSTTSHATPLVDAPYSIVLLPSGPGFAGLTVSDADGTVYYGPTDHPNPCTAEEPGGGGGDDEPGTPPGDEVGSFEPDEVVGTIEESCRSGRAFVHFTVTDGTEGNPVATYELVVDGQTVGELQVGGGSATKTVEVTDGAHSAEIVWVDGEQRETVASDEWVADCVPDVVLVPAPFAEIDVSCEAATVVVGNTGSAPASVTISGADGGPETVTVLPGQEVVRTATLVEDAPYAVSVASGGVTLAEESGTLDCEPVVNGSTPDPDPEVAAVQTPAPVGAATLPVTGSTTAPLAAGAVALVAAGAALVALERRRATA